MKRSLSPPPVKSLRMEGAEAQSSLFYDAKEDGELLYAEAFEETLASPSTFVTPPSSPSSCENLPQTPTPKKQTQRSPFRPQSGDAVRDWLSEIPRLARASSAADFGEESSPENIALDEHPLQLPQDEQHPQQQQQQQLARKGPVFHGSFLSDAEDFDAGASIVKVASGPLQLNRNVGPVEQDDFNDEEDEEHGHAAPVQMHIAPFSLAPVAAEPVVVNRGSPVRVASPARTKQSPMRRSSQRFELTERQASPTGHKYRQVMSTSAAEQKEDAAPPPPSPAPVKHGLSNSLFLPPAMNGPKSPRARALDFSDTQPSSVPIAQQPSGSMPFVSPMPKPLHFGGPGESVDSSVGGMQAPHHATSQLSNTLQEADSLDLLNVSKINNNSNNNNHNNNVNTGASSSIVGGWKQPLHQAHHHNRSLPAPSMKSPHRPSSSVPQVPPINISLMRSPAPNKPHSVSMLVTNPGPGLGVGGMEAADEQGNFLRTRAPMARTPRGVASNPFQHSPKSTMGSAKKKSRITALGNGVSRYVQDFEERQKIGAGHFSDVYECSHRMDGMTYAIKVLKEELSAPRMSRVMSEVFALAALPAHENLVRYYGCWAESNRLYIQTELCEAGNLENKLRGKHQFTEGQLCDLLRQVLAGLAHIHSNGVCHLDIKPENILITMVKEGVAKKPVYKIGDLGLVMKADLQDNFRQDVEGGDGRFMSPELMEGEFEKLRGNLEKSDIWSLGCTVYALARRRDLPTGGDEFASIRAGDLYLPENEYSPEFVELLKKMINPDVRKRLNAVQLLEEPMLLTQEVRKLRQNKLKKRRLKESLVDKDKEVEALRVEVRMLREKEAQTDRELARMQSQLDMHMKLAVALEQLKDFMAMSKNNINNNNGSSGNSSINNINNNH